jgi:hypothetical protein
MATFCLQRIVPKQPVSWRTWSMAEIRRRPLRRRFAIHDLVTFNEDDMLSFSELFSFFAFFLVLNKSVYQVSGYWIHHNKQCFCCPVLRNIPHGQTKLFSIYPAKIYPSVYSNFPSFKAMFNGLSHETEGGREWLAWLDKGYCKFTTWCCDFHTLGPFPSC